MMVGSHRVLTDAHMPVPMLRLATGRLGSLDTGVRPVRGRRTTSSSAPEWWARGQWSSREEDREKPARRERAGPGCQSGIQIPPPPPPPSPPAPGC